MLPLPKERFKVTRLIKGKTDNYSFVPFENNKYSTAPEYYRCEVWLEIKLGVITDEVSQDFNVAVKFTKKHYRINKMRKQLNKRLSRFYHFYYATFSKHSRTRVASSGRLHNRCSGRSVKLRNGLGMSFLTTLHYGESMWIPSTYMPSLPGKLLYLKELAGPLVTDVN